MRVISQPYSAGNRNMPRQSKIQRSRPLFIQGPRHETSLHHLVGTSTTSLVDLTRYRLLCSYLKVCRNIVQSRAALQQKQRPILPFLGRNRLERADGPSLSAFEQVSTFHGRLLCDNLVRGPAQAISSSSLIFLLRTTAVFNTRIIEQAYPGEGARGPESIV
ncbi:hypothetical protein BDZ85DRAFT_26443 [Elsinoe ampelina]|uniref:Uncharacterized protein n=1 Tax=Elsinoe ampelina TaxID=302913 RepID=A0A6A6G4D6_9PEZI|nr:hypothetical protein BDZ85DRAFT_26443 [Elsinoe ampelina]